MDSDKDKTAKDLPSNEEHGAKPSEAGEKPDQADEPTAARSEPTSSSADHHSPAPATTPSKPPSGGGLVLGSIAILLAIAACAGSVYVWYLLEVQQRHQQEIAAANLLGELKGVTESTRSLEKQQDKLAADQAQLNSLVQEKLEAGMAALQSQQDELTGSVTKLYDSLDRSIDSWALEEVEQLLRMANHSVELAGDLNIAAVALELADKRLEQLGNPQLLEVRRLIADEITQLRAVGQIDLPGLAFRLSSLAATVPKLPLISEPVSTFSVEEGGDPAGETSEMDNAWIEAGHELLADLKGLVRIQNVTEAAQPLLTPEQRYYLIANLRLMLSGAQIAVLRTDTQTYSTNLAQASEWLKQYFDTDDEAVQSMISELEKMAGQDLTPQRPNITGSILELQEVKSRMKSS